jgi:hypothetical protein
MSKNLTRKGLALGAIVALGTSLFAGAPAFAGVESTGVTLVANAGDTYTSINGAAFDLSTVLSTSALNAAGVTAEQLSYLVTNSAEADVKVDFNGEDISGNGAFRVASGASATTLGTLAAGNSTAITKKSILVTGDSYLSSGTNTGINSGAATTNHLVITTSADATDNVVLKVQAFVDENNNGKVDGFDLVSIERTLTFIPAKNVTTTTAITSAVIGTQVLKATVSLGNDVNMANLGTAVSIKVLKNGDTASVFKTTNVSYDSTDKLLKNLDTDTGVVLGTETYTAQAYFGTVKLGSASNAVTPANGTVASVDAVDAVALTASANTIASTGVVRSGYTGNVTFTSKVLDNASPRVAVAVAGVKVKVSVDGTLATASTFVAGGKTLTATSGAVSFETTTDADGKISFTGAGTGKAGDIVTVTVSALKPTGGYTTGVSKTITYTAAAVTAVKQSSLVGSAAVLKATVGGNVHLVYTLVDQFGQAVTAGTYRAAVTTTDVSGTQISAAAQVAAVAGKFDVNLTDNSVKAGNYDVNVAVSKYDADAISWVAVAVSVDAIHVYVNAVAAATINKTAEPSAAIATTTTAVSALDKRVDTNSAADLALGTGHTISGYVTDATGARVAGAVVSFAGAGYGFYTGGNVWTVGSATVNADLNGAYAVEVFSNVAGKGSVVITSGAATRTVAVEYTGITTLDKKGTITLDVASLSQVGRSVTVNILVKDSLGNPVQLAAKDVSVSVTGVGALSVDSVKTDATGKATVQFVAGANDFGDAVIVAKYTVLGATTADDVVVSATKTLTVGVTDAQVDIVGKRVTAVASFSKGKTVAFYVDGIKKWSKISSSDADVVLNYNLKKGTHTVVVKISGGFVTTEKFIVK